MAFPPTLATDQIIGDPIEAARYAASWNDRRRRMLLFWIAAYAFIAVIAVFGFLNSIDSNLDTNPLVIFGALFVFYMATGVWLNRFRCPRCGKLYYWNLSLKGSLARQRLWRNCHHCGLAQDAGPDAQNEDLTGPSTGNLRPRSVELSGIGVVLLPGFVVVVCLLLLNIRLLQSGAYQESLASALNSPQVQNALGSKPRQQYPALGFEFPFRHAHFAEWSLSLKGSRASGHLYGVATQINGTWDVSRLVFVSHAGDEPIDLTPVRRLQLPPVAYKTVYLVPLDRSAVSLAWMPAYYKAKLGIDISILAPISLGPELVNPVRHQLNADEVITFLQQRYPGLARDPSSVLIGMTSQDMYIPTYNWRYAFSYRRDGRYAVVSTARLHPPDPLGNWNPEWLNSRLQKILNKDLLILYFDLPKNDDPTSILSAGILSNTDLDLMGNGIVGSEGGWVPFKEWGDPAVTIYDVAGREQLWRMAYINSTSPDTGAQVFCADLAVGLLVLRKADFVFADEPALQFTRVQRNLDDRSRAFGIGGSHSFDIFLGGQMGVAVDLILEDGSRIHYKHQPAQAGQSGDIYLAAWGSDYRFSGTRAVFSGGSWEIKTTDGWTYTFPYRPKALPQYVTVLTDFTGPAGHTYKMERDAFGALLSVTSSSGRWLHFDNDSEHRIRGITSSTGRSVRYEYDSGGRMIRATDSDKNVDSYTFDEKAQMLTARHGAGKPFLTNEYFSEGDIKSQTMADGRKFSYFPVRLGNILKETQIKDPDGLQTYIQYEAGGYIQSLRAAVPH